MDFDQLLARFDEFLDGREPPQPIASAMTEFAAWLEDRYPGELALCRTILFPAPGGPARAV